MCRLFVDDGASRLVIAEIKKPGVVISSEEKQQPWRYVWELIRRGFVTNATTVTCYVLGSHVDPKEAPDDSKNGDRVTIRAMTYSTFIKRAERRMLGLRDTLRDAPFLREHGIDPDTFMQPQMPRQSEALQSDAKRA